MTVALDPAGEPAVPDRELVGPHAVEAKPEALREPPREPCESARDHHDAVAVPVESGEQPFRSRGERETAGDILERLDGKPRNPFEARPKRPVELDLAPHRGVGDRGHLPFGARRPRELVNALRIDEGRVHVEADEPPTAARAVFALDAGVERPRLRRSPGSRPGAGRCPALVRSQRRRAPGQPCPSAPEAVRVPRRPAGEALQRSRSGPPARESASSMRAKCPPSMLGPSRVTAYRCIPTEVRRAAGAATAGRSRPP